MSRLPGSRLSLAVKLTLLCIFVQSCCVAYYATLRHDIARAEPVARVLMIALPLVPGVLIIYFLTRFIVSRLTGPVVSAYGRLAGGDFGAQLPPMTTGADFLAVREAFASMAAALERSMQALRDADLERRKLFADLAHELGTPTSTLHGIALALRQEQGDRDRLLTHLEHESARLDRLIADVRELAQLEDPALPLLVEPCDIGARAAAAVDRARVAHPDACELRCEVEPAPITADPLRVDQVLDNLIANAIRHGRGGVVAVRVRAGGDGVTMRVEDSGAGVPAELLPQLGKRLVRIDPSRSRDTGGHGLGLAIVRAIVERHGGALGFERAALGGLAVDVRLPLDGDHHQRRSRQQ